MTTSHLAAHNPADHGEAGSVWRQRLRSPVFWAFLAFALVGLYYLLTEHPAHVLGYLPFALLLLCPFLHLLGGHGGHGGHGSHGGKNPGLDDDKERTP